MRKLLKNWNHYKFNSSEIKLLYDFKASEILPIPSSPKRFLCYFIFNISYFFLLKVSDKSNTMLNSIPMSWGSDISSKLWLL